MCVPLGEEVVTIATRLTLGGANDMREHHEVNARAGAYSIGEAARILGLSPARLRYWSQRDLLPRPTSPITPLRLGFADLAGLRKIVALRRRGVPLQRIRERIRWAKRQLPHLPNPSAALRADSDDAILQVDGVSIDNAGQLCLDWQQGTPSVASLRRTIERESPEERARLAFEEGCRADCDLEAAARAYRRAIELDPEFADAYCNLGTLFFNTGEREAAKQHYLAAIQAEPEHLEAHFNVANLYEEDGRDEAALRHYRRATAIDPLFADAHLNLALLYEKLELWRSARRRWRAYLSLRPTGHWAEIARERLES